MATATADLRIRWERAIALIRDRLPILRLEGDPPVDERVYRVEVEEEGTGGRWRVRELRLVTYSGRVVSVRDIVDFAFHIERTDRQGVPIAYGLELRTADGGTRTLRFYA